MKTIQVNDTTLAYETQGEGEPILLCHCGFIADGMLPLLKHPALANFKRINYHRRGYGASAPVAPPFSVAQQAKDALALLDVLGIERAHIVGHSMGANVALQLAVAAPERVQSLALLEPPLAFTMSEASLQVFSAVIGGAIAKLMAGDAKGAVDEWLTGAFGPGFREVLESSIPGSTQQMVKDAFTAIVVEGDSLQTWGITPADFARIRQPVVSVLHVDPYFKGFQEVHTALLNWLPQCQTLVIPNTTHLLQIAQPRAVAEGLASFLERQPALVTI
jgi:pimeloyl-ACP methyl ester carboxylesterase